MTGTAFGPQGPNYTITRPPADPAASAGVDTWFKNCSAAGAKDGTFATADFFNVTIGNLRYLCNEAGINLSDADPTMIYQAVEALIAQGLANATNAPSLPKCRVSSAAISSMPYGTYSAPVLSLTSNTNLVPVIAGNGLSFTLPVSGTYLIVSRAQTRIVVNNNTQISEQVAVLKNGALISQDAEETYLLAGQDLTIDHTLTALVSVTNTDVLSFASRAGTTNTGDYNLGQALGGYFDIIRVGP